MAECYMSDGRLTPTTPRGGAPQGPGSITRKLRGDRERVIKNSHCPGGNVTGLFREGQTMLKVDRNSNRSHLRNKFFWIEARPLLVRMAIQRFFVNNTERAVNNAIMAFANNIKDDVVNNVDRPCHVAVESIVVVGEVAEAGTNSEEDTQ